MREEGIREEGQEERGQQELALLWRGVGKEQCGGGGGTWDGGEGRGGEGRCSSCCFSNACARPTPRAAQACWRGGQAGLVGVGGSGWQEQGSERERTRLEGAQL